ncbi:CstA-like transporter-associated (seleno)protein [Streptomyces sp. DSM 44917]|uniref:CstA-like transporter-associated (Seleno)protein n=1 Tax=Streptomyces boetiae TaxID=3075541 RepID=A0ABU2L8I5_9ACTN|nr:CstA-like transporter-associated (seleno)protein [Streptomyces sp. DSM 44917]MDT0307781.1 CstA-like transporter-associated (seleno)protein [Streptomyces sp. DSM 44917]
MTAAPRRAAAWLRWYVTELTGENAYARYVERARAADPAAAVLSRREFERRRTDDRYRDPHSGHYRGCC